MSNLKPLGERRLSHTEAWDMIKQNLSIPLESRGDLQETGLFTETVTLFPRGIANISNKS